MIHAILNMNIFICSTKADKKNVKGCIKINKSLQITTNIIKINHSSKLHNKQVQNISTLNIQHKIYHHTFSVQLLLN